MALFSIDPLPDDDFQVSASPTERFSIARNRISLLGSDEELRLLPAGFCRSTGDFGPFSRRQALGTGFAALFPSEPSSSSLGGLGVGGSLVNGVAHDGGSELVEIGRLLRLLGHS
jgi:hypothetical protein